MTLALPFLVALLLLVAALIVFSSWRVTLPLLMGAELCRIGLIWQLADLAAAPAGRTLLIAELITAAAAGLILLITGLTFTREYQPAELDEFALMELRRAARRAQSQRAQMVGRWSSAVVPAGAVLLAGCATWLLATFYPVAREQLLDAGWIYLLLCGLIVLITAGDVLKLGLGLLLLAASAKLLYFGVATQLNILQIALWELLSLSLAVVVAYLSGMLYGRLRTLELDGLFERR